MPTYDPALTLRAARRQYWEQGGLPSDGGYNDRWVVLYAGGVPVVVFPNTMSRRKAVKVHDLHHVLTEYDTSWTGEAEIAAWELASGCGSYWAAWVLNFWAGLVGVLLFPRAVWRAWGRGRRSRSLYHAPFDEATLDETVGAVRHRLGIPPKQP